MSLARLSEAEHFHPGAGIHATSDDNSSSHSALAAFGGIPWC